MRPITFLLGSVVLLFVTSMWVINAAAAGGGTQNFSKTLSVDSRSGSAAVAVPLYVPEGRGGISPALGLAYAPTNGNGPFGWGMSMDMGSVVRSTKNGMPNYDSTDTFLVTLGGKNFELVSLGSNNEYRSKYDDDRVRFFLNNNVWSAKDKSGTTYYFGSRAGSTVNDGGTKTFKWKLDCIQDLFGNVLVVDYSADNSFEVRYGLMVGKSVTADVNNKANFAYVINAIAQTADRPDIFMEYKPGFAVSEKRLIASMTITGGGNLIKKYNFTYAQSVKTGRSLLKSVTEVGADGVTSQPVVNLQYNDATTSTYSVNSITDPVQGNNLWSCQVKTYDFGYLSNLSPIFTQSSKSFTPPSYTAPIVSWSISTKGDMSITSPGQSSIACGTYVYSKLSKSVTLTTNGNAYTVFVNGAQAISGPMTAYPASKSTAISLNAGYNYINFEASSYRARVQGYMAIYPYTFTLGNNLTDSVDLMNSSQAIFPQLSADFNGDGKTDVATYFPDTGTLKVALSNGTGFLPKTTWIDGFAVGKQLILGDFNGDGRTDVAAYDSSSGTVRVALSDGTKFVDSGIWLSGVPAGATVYTGDFNGGGVTDLYIMTQDASGWLLQVARSSGTGFAMGNTYRPHVGTTSAMIIPADVNGDGVTDLIGFDKATGTWSVHINSNGFNEKEYYSSTSFGTNMTPVVADFNQDGRADVGYFDAANKKVVYLPSVAGGFGAQQTMTFNFTLTDPTTTQLQVADFNGDGIMDFMTFDSMGHSDLAISGSTKFQDLVTSYDNGVGGTVSMSYGSSSDLTNTYLPFAIPVVLSVTASNNLGSSFVTSYAYSGSYWNPTEREMYGFKEARVIDADGNYSLSQFNQDSLYMRGHLDRTAVYGADGKLYQETKYQWNNDSVISGRTDVRFVSPKRVDNFVYDTAATPPTGLRTATETTYDVALGVPTEIRDYGQVDWTTGADVGTDYIRTVLTYGSNAANYIYGLVTSKISYDMNSAILARSYAYYDGSTIAGTVTNGLVTRSDVWNKVGTVESLLSTYNTYNGYGQLLTSKDPLNNTTSVAYDATWSMFPLTTTNAKGFIKTSEYYGVNSVALTGGIWGMAKSITDPNSQKLTSTYDAFGRVISEINPLDSLTYPTTTYEYLTKTNYRVLVAHRRVEHGLPTTIDSYTYIDGLGRSLVSKTPSATAGTYVVSGHASVNNRGLVIKEYPAYFSTSGYDVLELPVTTRSGTAYDYDAMGRRVKTTFADGSFATNSFTPTTSSVIDPNGHKMAQVRDARGRIVRVEEWSGADGRALAYPSQAFALYAATIYAYDTLGNLLSVTDAKGSLTTMSYDALGRKGAMNDPDMHNVSYVYDALGQLTKQTDAKNIPFAFTYDAIGRILTKKRADNGADSVPYTYDMATGFGKGRLAKATYTAGSASFNYDAIGEEITSSKLIGTTTYNVTRTYDALGRIKTLVYPDSKGTAVYGYNLAGQLSSVQLKVTVGTTSTMQNIVNGIDYTANGSIQKITYGNGAVAAYVYDPLMFRLQTQVVTDKNSVAVQYNAYTYDPVGNIMQAQDKVKNTAKTYTYDALDRMISSNDGSGVISYVYDQVGNITNKGNLVYAYGQNGAGPHAVTAITDGSTMTYDANGNMATYKTMAKTQYYTYDTRNRLTNVQAMDTGTTAKYSVADYTYDGDGGRTTKKAYVKSGTTTTIVATNYVGDIYEESVGVKTDYIFLGGSRVAAYDGTRVRWFIGDHLGSASTILDETSAVKEKIEYTPWGEVKSYDNFGNTTEVARFYFTGKKFDDETGLVYFGARYYNPKLGRFITPDTIVQSPYNPQTLNRYTYCNNNPINLVDLDGHKWSWKSFANSFVGAAIGAVITVATGGLGAPIAFALGGMVAGATSAALNGAGWQGILTSAAIGGVLGGVGGWATTLPAGFAKSAIIGGMLAGGLGYTAATGSWDSFAGGLAGGVAGYVGAKAAVGMINKWQQNSTINQGGAGNTEKNSPKSSAAFAGKSLSNEPPGWNDSKVTIGDPEPFAFDPEPKAGISVYRIIGGDSGPYGRSWTTVDPSSMINPRNSLGLPIQNTGRFVVEGRLQNTQGVFLRPGGAIALYGTSGGAPELLIPNAKTQVKINNVSGVNPQY